MVSEGVDIPALLRWMDAHSLGTGPIEHIERLTGGTQNILLRFERQGRVFVLRRPPLRLRANSNRTMEREARVLAALGQTEVPHPGLIAACNDPDVIGASFYLMESVDGFNAANGLPPYHAGNAQIRRRMGFAMVEAIAKLSAVDYRKVGLEDFGRLDNYLERQVGRWAAQLASYGDFPAWPGPHALPGVERIGQWLEDHRPPAFRPGIIHGDFHLANVMFHHDSGELAAIIDWELSTLGDPLLDLAWMVVNWPEEGVQEKADFGIDWDGFASADELASHYQDVTGRRLDHFDWFVVLACYKLGIILEGTYARACAGQAPREIGDLLHTKAIDLFERALRRIN